jgi:transcriptional regulator GlxA family with amidase domain
MLEPSSTGTVLETCLRMDARIASVLERMETDLERPLSVAELAAGVNLSSSRLLHLFRAEIGVPPVRYLRDLRLRRARAALETTFLSVKEVMVQVGFSDPSHFSRAFKLRYGVSPRALRGRARRLRRRAGVRVRDPGRSRKRQESAGSAHSSAGTPTTEAL